MSPASDRPKKGGKGLVHELCYAVRMGDMRRLRSVLNCGADIDQEFQEHGGLSPIFLAIMKKNEEMVKFLIKQACNVDKTGKKQETPLFYAIRSGKPKLVKLLLETGCNVNHVATQDNLISQPIFVAIQQGNTEIVRLLIDYGVDLNCVDRTKKPLCFGISLYRRSFDDELRVTRRQSPMSIIDIIYLMIPRLDWGLEKSLFKELDLLMMAMCLKGQELTIFKEMMKHGAPIGGFVYLQLLRNGTTPPPCEFFTPEFFHFFVTAHQFCELYAEFITSCVDLRETPGNRELVRCVREYFQQPPDLETLCCQRIRKELTVNRWERIDALDIPVTLKDMLKLTHY